MQRAVVSPVGVEPFQLLQEDVAAGDRVVRVRHDEELQDGAPVGPQEKDGAVPVRPRLRIHHYLIQLVPGADGQSDA